MTSEFKEMFAKRTRKFAIEVVFFCRTFEKSDEAFIIKKQLIRSASSVAANYRASCRGRSRAEWFSKICIVVEEADETEFWLTMVKDVEIKCDLKKLEGLTKESQELLKIVSKSRKTAKDNN